MVRESRREKGPFHLSQGNLQWSGETQHFVLKVSGSISF